MEPAGLMILLVFPVGPMLLGLYAWRRHRGTFGAASSVPVWPGAFNASLAFALAFNIIYFVQEFFLAWPKALLPGVEAVVYHNNHGWAGAHPDVILYQGAGAVAIVTLGALLTLVGSIAGKRLRGASVLWWWTAALALGLGLVQFTIAAMHPDNDVGQAFDHLALSPLTRNTLALIGALGAIGFGLLFTRPLLAMAPAGSVDTPRSRVIYVLKFSILPMLVGTAIAFAYRAPPMGHLTMPLFSGLYVLPWTLAAAALMPAPAPTTDRLHRGVDVALVIANAVLLAFFWLVLAPGLSV